MLSPTAAVLAIFLDILFDKLLFSIWSTLGGLLVLFMFAVDMYVSVFYIDVSVMFFQEVKVKEAGEVLEQLVAEILW